MRYQLRLQSILVLCLGVFMENFSSHFICKKEGKSLILSTETNKPRPTLETDPQTQKIKLNIRQKK